jgi:hypothetical protein
MLEIHKKIVLDEDKKPFAVQIPIKEFERLEEVLENYALSKLMDEVKDDGTRQLSARCSTLRGKYNESAAVLLLK